MPQWTQEAVDALKAAVSGRRHHLGRSQIEVWRGGGPANSTMTSLEAAASTSVTRSTLTKLDAGLEWVPDTAAKVVRGEITPDAAVHDPRFDARPHSGDDQAATTHDELVALVAVLAVEADDIRLTTRVIDTDVDANDPQQVQSFVARVHDVFGDVDDFADTVDDVARKVFGGDTERLRRAKREAKRRRRLGSESATPVLRAARTAPPDYRPGRADQGEGDPETTDGH